MESELIIRSIADEQVDSVYRLFTNQNIPDMEHILGFAPTLNDIRRHTIDDPDFDPDFFFGVFQGDELVGNILGIYRSWTEMYTDTGFIKWIVVKKDFHGTEVNQMLLQACENALREEGITKIEFGSCAPRYIFPGVPQQHEQIYHVLESSGWIRGTEYTGLFTDLNVETITQEEYEHRMQRYPSSEVSIAESGDEKELLDFIKREFSYSWAVEVRPVFNRRNDAFCTILRSVDSGNILGFAVVNATNPHWFGPMGLRNDIEDVGVGQLLLYRTLLEAQTRGIEQIVFPWIDENESFYLEIVKKAQRQIFYQYTKELIEKGEE